MIALAHAVPGTPQARLRVAYLVDTLTCATAGTEKQVLETLHRLDRERYEVDLITLRESAWLRDARLPCPRHLLNCPGFFHRQFPAAVLRLRRLIRARGFNVLQTFFEESVFVAALATLGDPRRPVMIASRRDVGIGAEHLWYHTLFDAARPVVYRCFDAVAANSETVRRHLIEREGVDAGKARIVPNGVGLPPRDTPRPRLYRDHPAAVWVVMVANLRPIKRIDLLIEALASLRDREGLLTARVAILGEGPERGRLEDLIRRRGLEGRVFVPGRVDDVWPYLRHAEIGVQCSDLEGASNAVLEYLAAGLPVVVTPVGENRELVDGTNGRVVPRGDRIALAAALAELVCDPGLRRSLGERSRRRVTERNSWQTTLEAWQHLYSELATRRGEPRL